MRISMKKAMLLAAFVAACGPAEQATTDTPAMAAGPAPLTAADVSGTWTGTTMPEVGDSILRRWTVTGDGMQAKFVEQGTTDTVMTTATFDADSMILTSAPHVDKRLPGSPTVTFRSVGRLTGDQLAGTALILLASKPDSVLMRVRWQATKAP
jgi:hypothetical protein